MSAPCHSLLRYCYAVLCTVWSCIHTIHHLHVIACHESSHTRPHESSHSQTRCHVTTNAHNEPTIARTENSIDCVARTGKRHRHTFEVHDRATGTNNCAHVSFPSMQQTHAHIRTPAHETHDTNAANDSDMTHNCKNA